MNITVRDMASEDWDGVRTVLLEGIASGNATFETAASDWDDWSARHLRNPRLVASADGALVGWAALSPVSDRTAYSGVAEVSIYVRTCARQQGVGKALLQALIERSEKTGLWTLQAGVFPENGASLALHRSCGFRVVGRRERIGKLHGLWRDVILMERRSPTTGR